MNHSFQNLPSLWSDDTGAVISTELVLVAVVAVLGLMTGFVSMRDEMVSELSDVSGSIDEMNQSYSFNGLTVYRDKDGNVVFDNSHPPINEGDELVLPDIPEPIVHTVSDTGFLDIDNVNPGVGGSVTGDLAAGDGTTAAFTTTTDNGNISTETLGNISFFEDPATTETITTTFAQPITDLELFLGSIVGGADPTTIGNFTVTLSDGTVLNNAAFSILPDAVGGGTVGPFSTFGSDNQLLVATTIGGIGFVQDAAGGGQSAGRIVFDDVPGPGEHCIGISSVSFERSGGIAGFRSMMNFSGRIVEIQP